ncbi:hypothetical protein [Ilumatobacter sp.]|uniref:hypothetical protein n=1 Tax=Ilumatobacter sp. TaxID=1967498 RepID=UPI003B5195FB
MQDVTDSPTRRTDPAASHDATTRADEVTPFVLGGAVRPSVRGAVALATLLAFCALPVRGLYRATGSSMEEGFMLVFPRLVQQGRVPNVDFLHLYGPGSLDVLSVWYRVFGYTLEAQRTFGLVQNLGIVLAAYALARVAGRTAAVGAGGVAALLIMTPIGLSALAWHGGVALSMWSVVVALRARRTGHRIDWAGAGALAGSALTFRPDLTVAVALALAFCVWAHRRSGWRPLVCGAAVGLVPMWVHLVVAGIGPSIDGMVIDPVVRLRPGRELPRPPSWGNLDGTLQIVAETFPPWWGLPAPAAEKQIFTWFFLVCAVAVGVPAWAWIRRRRGDRSPVTTVLVGAGLLGLGILPQALQRPDSTHLAWVAVASWPLVVVLLADVVARRRSVDRERGGGRPDGPSWWPGLAGTLTVGLVMLVVCPFFTYRHYVLHARVSAGDLPLPFLVERDGRRFWFGDPVAAGALGEMVVELDRRSEPGDRLVVGPADLSRAVYSDVSVYYLFPELEPATYFVEMDPGLADVAGSGLAQDIASADFVVLTNLWTGWREPNASSEFRSQEHNRAVADGFCLVGRYAENMVLLFERCEGGGGVLPQEVPGPYPLPEDPLPAAPDPPERDSPEAGAASGGSHDARDDEVATMEEAPR